MKKTIKWSILMVAVTVIVLAGAVGFPRYYDNCRYRTEMRIAKQFLKSTIILDQPTSEWLAQCASHDSNTFFAFKVWFVEAGATSKMIDWAYINYPAFRETNAISFDLKYGFNLPDIQCRITTTDGMRRVAAAFPLNNCFFDPDYNRDGRVDMEDVRLAEKERKRIQ